MILYGILSSWLLGIIYYILKLMEVIWMSSTVQMGKASLAFHEPVYIQSAASIVGKKEGEGPLKHCFDMISEDPRFGTDTWENAESTLQKETAILGNRKSRA